MACYRLINSMTAWSLAVMLFLGSALPVQANPLPAPHPIQRAIWDGNADLVEKMLASEDPSIISRNNWLQMAAGQGNVDVVNVLLNHGADVRKEDLYGLTALHRADNPAIAKILLDRGADLSARSKDGWTPLRTALKYDKSLDLVRYMIERGADVNDTGSNENDLIEETLMFSCKPKALGILLDAGADPNRKDKWGKSPLSKAKENGHAECAEVLRQHGARE